MQNTNLQRQCRGWTRQWWWWCRRRPRPPSCCTGWISCCSRETSWSCWLVGSLNGTEGDCVRAGIFHFNVTMDLGNILIDFRNSCDGFGNWGDYIYYIYIYSAQVKSSQGQLWSATFRFYLKIFIRLALVCWIKLWGDVGLLEVALGIYIYGSVQNQAAFHIEFCHFLGVIVTQVISSPFVWLT